MTEADQDHAPDPRVAVRMPARISTIDAEVDPFTGKHFFRSCEETCANVSRGGAFVVTREAIPPGSRLLVELRMPGGRRLQTLGRVAWTRITPSESPAGTAGEPGIGIEFAAGTRDLQELDRFVTRTIRSRRLGPELVVGARAAEQS